MAEDPGVGRRPTRRLVLRQAALTGAGALLAACAPQTSSPPPSRTATPSPTPRWRTVFEDTFASGRVDGATWTAADHGGNRDLGELQYNDPALVAVEAGNLVLHAADRPRADYPFVAGSISTKDKLTVGPYGRLTTRQLLGPGHGLGFGVCLYGADIDAVGWPACGEIDATEVALARPGSPFGSVHGPGYSGGSPISATWSGESLVDRWAEHQLVWEPDRISWAIDGEVYHVAEASDPRAVGWPFDQPFFITVVLTVGSHASGPVDLGTWPRDVDGRRTDAYAVLDLIRFEQYL